MKNMEASNIDLSAKFSDTVPHQSHVTAKRCGPRSDSPEDYGDPLEDNDAMA